MDVLGDTLRARSPPGQPEGGIGIMGHPVHLVFMEGPAVIPLVVISIAGGGAVGRIDTVLSLCVVLVDVAAAVVQVTLRKRHAPDIVGGRLLVALDVDAIPQAVLLRKIRHAPRARRGGALLLGPPPAPGAGIQGVGAVAGAGRGRHAVVLSAGLAGAGGAVVQDLGAAAALGLAEGEERPVVVQLRQQVRLGLQTATPLAAVLGGCGPERETGKFVKQKGGKGPHQGKGATGKDFRATNWPTVHQNLVCTFSSWP